MVLGIGSKSKKASLVKVSYVIHIEEIKPWPENVSSHDKRPVFLTWESGDKLSGRSKRQTPEGGSDLHVGRIVFNECFILLVTLESTNTLPTQSGKFKKKLLEFELYETKSDKNSKGKQLGSAVVDLADYGVIKSSISVNVPFSIRRNSKNAAHPSLSLNISPPESDASGCEVINSIASPYCSSRGSLSTNMSLDKECRDALSVKTCFDKGFGVNLTENALSDQEAEEVEIASFTDDDESPCSLSPVNVSALEEKANSIGTELEPSMEFLEAKEERQVKKPQLESLAEEKKFKVASALYSAEEVSSVTFSLSSATSSSNPLPSSFETKQDVDIAPSQLNFLKSSDLTLDHPIQNPSSSRFTSLEHDSYYKIPKINDCCTGDEKKSSAIIEKTSRPGKGKEFTSDAKIFGNDRIKKDSTKDRVSHSRSTSGNVFIKTTLQGVARAQQNNQGKDPRLPVRRRTASVSNIDLDRKELTASIFQNKIYEANSKSSETTNHREQVLMEGAHTTFKEATEVNKARENTLSKRDKTMKEERGRQTDSYQTRGTKSSMERAVAAKPVLKSRDQTKKPNKAATESRNFAKNNAGSKSTAVQDNKTGNTKVRSKLIADLVVASSEFDDKLVEEVKEISISETQSTDSGNGVSCSLRSETSTTPSDGDTITSDILENESTVAAPDVVTAAPAFHERAENGGINGTNVKAEKLILNEDNKKIIFAEARAAVADEKSKQLQLQVERLEGELREAALLEAAIYSVVAEHEGSFQKVHSSARRLARFYIHACKNWGQDRRAGAAKTIVSGLILAVKACGNDVSRLMFWLSNSVVLREIISQTFESSIKSSQVSRVNGPNGFKKNQRSPSPQKHADNKSRKRFSCIKDDVNDWQETQSLLNALEVIESWIYKKVFKSIWWETVTPYMKCLTEDAIEHHRKSFASRNDEKIDSLDLDDHEQGNFSLELWKKVFLGAFQRLCPVQAEGHDCGCLTVLSKKVIEECVTRIDVAILNAILRDKEDDMLADPLSEPISDPDVLPISAISLSFGSGVQLKNAVANWSRYLDDLVGIDSEDSRRGIPASEHGSYNDTVKFSAFTLLNQMSKLLMLPKDSLTDKSVKKEACPSLSWSLIKRVLAKFVADEFCPEPVPNSIIRSIDAEILLERRLCKGKDLVQIFPLPVPSIQYSTPPAELVREKIGSFNSNANLGRSSSGLLMKGYSSDDELNVLESPLILLDETTNEAPSSNSESHSNGNGKVAGNKKQTDSSAVLHKRYELLREAWG